MSPRTILSLADGRGIDLLNPKASDINFAVMAEHLAKEPRFNGATPSLIYSVAEHSIRGADAAFEATNDPILAAYFLLHDGHEYVLKDDTTPKKRALAAVAEDCFGVLGREIMGAFNELTDRHDEAIHEAAGLAWPPSEECIDAIKHWDLVMFVTEWRDLMNGIEHPNWEPYRDIEPLKGRISPWDWVPTRSLFISRCRKFLPALRAAVNDDLTRAHSAIMK